MLATTTATVTDAALTLTGSFQSGDPMTDAQSSFPLAVLTDANPSASTSDYTVTINWGDGSPPSTMTGLLQSMGNGSYLIVGSHSYANPYPNVGPVTYTVTVSVTDVDGASATTTSTVVVGGVSAGVPASMSAWWFQDQNSTATAGDFVANGQTGVALINWGDGTSSLGTVGTGGGGSG